MNATGPLQSGVYNLIFSGSGARITEIDVVVGQKVTKDQVLAQLDKTQLQDAVNQADTAVANAQAALNAAMASSNSSTGQSSANVSAAQTAVSNQQAAQNQTQTQGQTNVDAAQTALNNAEANLSQVTQTADLQKQQAQDVYNATYCNDLLLLAPPPTTTPSPATCQVALDTYNKAVNDADASIAAAQAQVDAAQAALNQAQTTADTNNLNAQNQVNTAREPTEHSTVWRECERDYIAKPDHGSTVTVEYGLGATGSSTA